MKKSKLKTDKDGFNNLPSRKEIEEALQIDGIEPNYVDLDEVNYWSNSYDTLVILVDNMRETMWWGEFAVRQGVDEFHYDFIEKEKAIIRLWWD